MAQLAYQAIDLAGTAKNYSAATVTVGDQVIPDERGFVHVKNGSGGSINVTIVVPGAQYGQARPDIVVAVGAGAEKMFGPMIPDLADTSDGLIDIICSAVTSVTIAAVRI